MAPSMLGHLMRKATEAIIILLKRIQKMDWEVHYTDVMPSLHLYLLRNICQRNRNFVSRNGPEILAKEQSCVLKLGQSHLILSYLQIQHPVMGPRLQRWKDPPSLGLCPFTNCRERMKLKKAIHASLMRRTFRH